MADTAFGPLLIHVREIIWCDDLLFVGHLGDRGDGDGAHSTTSMLAGPSWLLPALGRTRGESHVRSDVAVDAAPADDS